MKIAYLAAGNSIHTVRWVNALIDRGHEMHLLTQHGSDSLMDGRAPVHRLPFAGKAGYFLNGKSAKRILRRIKPDLLHAHYASGYGTLGRRCRFHPFILSVWGSDIYEFPEKSPLHRYFIRKNLEAADHLCSTSRAMAERARAISPRTGNITITPFGVDPAQFSPPSEREDTDSITIGTVKTLAFIYGIDLLLRAFAKVREGLFENKKSNAEKLRLLIVGEGPDRPGLENLARELKIAEVCEFRGRIDHEKVPDQLRRMDIHVLPSRMESFGVAALEASACEIPVVATAVGGLPEVIENEKTGLLVEKENPEALASALMRLIEDPALRERLGRAGRKRVLEKYDWRESVSTMESIYESALANGPGNS